MPKPGNIDHSTVDDLLTNNKIKLLESFKGAKSQHQMQCLVCNHIWSATPLSKKQTFKKYGVGGCPQCNTSRRTDRYNISRTANIISLLDRGIKIIDPDYDGRRHVTTNSSEYHKVLVENINCGHQFYCSPTNLFLGGNGGVECGVCGPRLRAYGLTTSSKTRSAEWQLTAPEWKVYRSKVDSLTTTIYRNNKHIINPDNLPRGIAGEDGKYHLDHIVPARFCFENNIPIEMCAHVDNLQMLYWRDNVSMCDNIKDYIPEHIQQFINDNNIVH